MKKLCGLLLAVSLLVIPAGCSWPSDKDLVLTGLVETSIYSTYSEVAGKIIESPVELGQEVHKDDLIAVIDDSDQRFALEQLQAALAKKKAALTELRKGSEAEQIKQGRNNVSLAERAVGAAEIVKQRAQDAYGRAENLLAGGGLSQAAFDETRYQLELANLDLSAKQIQLDNACQQLALLLQGASQEKIDAAQADVEQTESQIRQAEQDLVKFKVMAVGDGIVISKNYRLGDIVAPGFNLAEVASDSEKVLVAYLPEDNLAAIDYDQEMTIRRGAEQFTGTVSFIDAKAQYTPKEMQTAANKNKDSVKIKVRLGADSPLKVGEKAELVPKQKN